jgi:hypothetical protein
MPKSLTRPVFAFAEVIGRIDTSDKVAGLHAAADRYESRLSELERQFETKASVLRMSYMDEVLQIHGGTGAV